MHILSLSYPRYQISKESGVKATARYQRIKKNLNVPFLLPNMAFIVYETQIFQPFVLLFQAEEPLKSSSSQTNEETRRRLTPKVCR